MDLSWYYALFTADERLDYDEYESVTESMLSAERGEDGLEGEDEIAGGETVVSQFTAYDESESDTEAMPMDVSEDDEVEGEDGIADGETVVSVFTAYDEFVSESDTEAMPMDVSGDEELDGEDEIAGGETVVSQFSNLPSDTPVSNTLRLVETKKEPRQTTFMRATIDSSSQRSLPLTASPSVTTANNAEDSLATSAASKKLAEELELLKDQKLCKICLVEEASMAFVPCGHLMCCKDCDNKLSTVWCPICRQKIKWSLNTYRC